MSPTSTPSPKSEMARLKAALEADRLAVHIFERRNDLGYLEDAFSTSAHDIAAALSKSAFAQGDKKLPLLSLTLLPYGERIKTFETERPEFNVGYLFDLTQSEAQAHAPARVVVAFGKGLQSGDELKTKVPEALAELKQQKGICHEIHAYFDDLVRRNIYPEAAAGGPEGLAKGEMQLDAVAAYHRRQTQNPQEFNEVIAAVSKDHVAGVVVQLNSRNKSHASEHFAVLRACELALKHYEREGTFLPIVAYDIGKQLQTFVPLATSVDGVYRLMDQMEKRWKQVGEETACSEIYNHFPRAEVSALQETVASLNRFAERHYGGRAAGHRISDIREIPCGVATDIPLIEEDFYARHAIHCAAKNTSERSRS